MQLHNQAVCSSNITIHEHSDHIVRQTITCVLIFWKCTCISKTECNKYCTTYMYSWYTLFRGNQGQFSDWNGQQRHAWIVTCRRGFELSELCFLWVQDWIQVHLISFFGVFCNFKTNHIFTILQLKVKMMWFFSWIFIYEDILWYLLYKEWMSLTVSPEHYLPGHLLKHFLHVHGIILSIVHVKVILRKIENCCDYSCLWTLQLPDQICNSPYCQPYNS